MKLKLKLTKNNILIGLLLGVIIFCTFKNCSFVEGFSRKKINRKMREGITIMGSGLSDVAEVAGKAIGKVEKAIKTGVEAKEKASKTDSEKDKEKKKNK